MSFPKIRVVVAALTFIFGASFDHYMRMPGSFNNCFGCTNARCVLVFVADHPVASLTHPEEIYRKLSIVRWLD